MEYFGKASTAREETKKAEYEEILKVIGNGLRPDKVLNKWSSEKYLDQYEEEIPKDEKFKEAEVERRTSEMILVTTKENWVYMIKENEVKFLGLKDQIIAPDLIDTNVTFTPSKDTWTNQPITVEISTAITGHYLEYSTDGKNWTSYTGSIKVEENQTIYARLNNVADFHGESATYKIDWIDRVDPSGEIVTGSIEENTITVS